MNRKVACELMRVAKILVSAKKDEDTVDWWRKAFKWYNKKYPKRALPLKEIDNGFKWGDLKVYVGKLGVTAVGGLYTQYYVDHFLLTNAPIQNPPVKRPKKPSGYDKWLEKQSDLKIARSRMAADEVDAAMWDLLEQMEEKIGKEKLKGVFEETDKKVLGFQVQNKLVYMLKDIGADAQLRLRGYEPKMDQFARQNKGFKKPKISDKAAADYFDLNDNRSWTYARNALVKWAKQKYGMKLERNKTI